MYSIFNNLKLFSSPQNILKRQLDCIQWKTNYKISSNSKDHYEVLNLSRNCTSKEIRNAFIALSKQYHPDKNKENPKAKEEFIRVSEAYNVLIKPESRRNYDFTLKSFSEQPDRVYKSTKKDDYYEVHRYDSQFRDPWKDPSFYRNRKFGEDDSYYGVRGLKKQTNQKLLFWLFLFAGVGLFVQISIIRFANTSTRLERERQSEINRRHLEYVRSRAAHFGTRERQMEELNRRAGILYSDVPVNDTIIEDEPK